MKPEYVNRTGVVLNATDNEVNVSFEFAYIASDLGADIAAEWQHTEIARVVMRIDEAEMLSESLAKCVKKYKDYIEKEEGENER